jgi:hypothetical protein
MPGEAGLLGETHMNRTKIALTALTAVFAMSAVAPAFAADKPAVAATNVKTAPAKAKHHHHKKKTDASATATTAPKAK